MENNIRRWDRMFDEMLALRNKLCQEIEAHKKENDHQSVGECLDAVRAIDLAMEKGKIVAGS